MRAFAWMQRVRTQRRFRNLHSHLHADMGLCTLVWIRAWELMHALWAQALLCVHPQRFLLSACFHACLRASMHSRKVAHRAADSCMPASSHAHFCGFARSHAARMRAGARNHVRARAHANDSSRAHMVVSMADVEIMPQQAEHQ